MWKFSPPLVMFPFTTRIGFDPVMMPVTFCRTSSEYVSLSVVTATQSRNRTEKDPSCRTASTKRTWGLPALYSDSVSPMENNWFVRELTVSRVVQVEGGV